MSDIEGNSSNPVLTTIITSTTAATATASAEDGNVTSPQSVVVDLTSVDIEANNNTNHNNNNNSTGGEDPTTVSGTSTTESPIEVIANKITVEATNVAEVGGEVNANETTIAQEAGVEPSQHPMAILGRAILRCVGSKVGYCTLIFMVLVFTALSITFFVYTIIALVRTSNSEQKSLCHQSDAWVYILVHLILGAFIYQQSNNNNNDDDENTCKACWQLLKGLTQLGLTAWGIYELWGVSCIDSIKDKLLYIILQIYVIVDIISIGCCFVVLCTICNYYFCKGFCNSLNDRRQRREDLRTLRSSAEDGDGNASGGNHAIPAVEVPSDQASAVVMEV